MNKEDLENTEALLGVSNLASKLAYNSSLHDVSNPLHVEEFHIGFWYEEYQMDNERYLNKGMVWVKKQYGFNSPRLHKINELIKKGKLRRCQ